MTGGTLLRLAMPRTGQELSRMVLTALAGGVGAVVILAAGVVSVGSSSVAAASGDFTSQGWHDWAAAIVAVLLFPVTVLLRACAGMGANFRLHRLAALRMLGATPGQARSVAAVEGAVAAFAGTLAAIALFLVGRQLLSRGGYPPGWSIACALVGVPVLTGLAAVAVTRHASALRLDADPRVAGRRAAPARRRLIVVLTLVFLVGVASWGLVGTAFPAVALGAALLVFPLLCGLWVRAASRLLSGLGRWPSALVAGRWLRGGAGPGLVTVRALGLGAIAAAAAAWYVSWLRAHFRAEDQTVDAINRDLGRLALAPHHEVAAFDLMRLAWNVALGMLGIVATALVVHGAVWVLHQRRRLAFMIAGGVPRLVLARAVAWQGLAVAVPLVLIGLVLGTGLGLAAAGRTVHGPRYDRVHCAPPPDQPLVCDSADPTVRAPYTTRTPYPLVTESVPVPWADLGLVAALGLGADVLALAVGVVVLATNTRPELLRTV